MLFDKMEHVNIYVTGKVQGVFFRRYAEMKAHELGVSGFVKNLPDGSVYIEAEGAMPALMKLVEWCRKGSPLSTVSDVRWEKGPYKNFVSFSMER